MQITQSHANPINTVVIFVSFHVWEGTYKCNAREKKRIRNQRWALTELANSRVELKQFTLNNFSRSESKDEHRRFSQELKMGGDAVMIYTSIQTYVRHALSEAAGHGQRRSRIVPYVLLHAVGGVDL